MAVQNSIYSYVTQVTPDSVYTLSVTPQKVLTESISSNQVVFISDDNSNEEVVTLGTETFYFILQWDILSDADAATIWDCWITYAVGLKNSFIWQHPLDGHTYAVKFEDDVKRLLYPGPKRSIPELKLKVKGYVT
jgi:hypothetical protein